MSPRPTQLAGKRLLVLGTWDMRDAALASWAQAGIEVTLVDGSASSRPGPAARRVDLDVWDSADPTMSTLCELASTADGVVTLAEFCTVTAARVAQAAGLPGPSVSAARLARDKVALRRRLAGAGVRGPRFAVVRDEPDIAKFFAAGVNDAVLKPADSAGSTAVVRVGSAAEAIDALAGVLRWSFSGRAILEQFIAGREFSVEAIVRGGVTTVAAIVEKATIPQGFVEFRHVVPADLAPVQSAALARAASGVVRALEVRDAIVHAEFRLGPEGFVPIEVAVRPAGGLIPDLLELATGFDLYRAQAALALGQPPEPAAIGNGSCAGVQFVTATGTVQSDAPLDELLEDHPELDRAGALVACGTVIPELDTNGIRAGYVMGRAAERGALHRLLEAASIDLAERMGLIPVQARTPVAA
jgi:biotin carboxylase